MIHSSRSLLSHGLLALALVPASALAQSILTIAGGGPNGDGRAATEATLRTPYATCVDPKGNLFVTDTGRVRRVDAATGVITTYAGGGSSGRRDGGPATEAELFDPWGLAVDASGNLFVAHQDRVRRVDGRTGVITTIAGGGNPPDGIGDRGPATGAILGPRGVAVDSNGNLFVADSVVWGVRRIDVRTGIITTVAGSGVPGFSGDGGPATSARFSQPWGVHVSAEGDLFIADSGNSRVRRVRGSTGIVDTVAGTGADRNTGDGGPATAAGLRSPTDLVVDPSGSLYVNGGSAAVRRVSSASGIIETIAGSGGMGFGGDGGPATLARLNVPRGLSLDAAGRLHIADCWNHRVRRVDTRTGVISTIAGGAGVGDGGPATSAQLVFPSALALDEQGDLYVADTFNDRVRRLRRSTGAIETYAGTGDPAFGADGDPATRTGIRAPIGLALDPEGNLHLSANGLLVRRIDRATGIVTTVAGDPGQPWGLGGDGGPATLARFADPYGIAFDGAGNLYVADSNNHRVRKVTRSTGIISTVAGKFVPDPSVPQSQPQPGAFSGDGGPATAAELDMPRGVAVDAQGNLFIADTNNRRIRRVDSATGTISTFAGAQDGTQDVDGLPASQSDVGRPSGVTVTRDGSVWVGTDLSRVLRFDPKKGHVRETVAGAPPLGFTGDGGPATAARLYGVPGVAIDPAGNLFFTDSGNSRVRAVYACTTVGAPSLVAPAPDESSVSTAAALTWAPVPGAFRYDVLLDTANPPRLLAASDLTVPVWVVAGLAPGTRYLWQAVAKGDPYCAPVSSAPSEVRSFTTAGACSSPGAFDLASPAPAERVASSVTLSWQPSNGAAAYDLYLGPSSPPTLFRTGITSTSSAASGLTSGTTYAWFVVAHAACDGARVVFSPSRSFKVEGPCNPAGAFSLTAPADSESVSGTSATLSWTASPNAASYDLYLGLSPEPSFYLADVAATSARVTGLLPARTYYWKVVAKVPCDPAKSFASPLFRFQVAGTCAAPAAPSFTFSPPGRVAAGQTYVLAWSEVSLDPGSGYVVERSLSPSFSPVLDSQTLSTTFASFVSSAPGTYHHRVRAVAGCDPAKTSPPSEPRSVEVVAAPANIVFSVAPEAVVTTLGQKLEDRKTTFTLENIGPSTLQVLLGKAEVASVPFFRIVDPLGGDGAFVTLEPRKPRSFELRFSGPPNDVTASYQGLVFVAATGSGLAVTPYAFVNLKVGGQPSRAPVFALSGTPVEYAFFPPWNGDDASRPPLTVEVRNPSPSPMELGAEVAPEVWLLPEPGWNATPIPPGGARTVKLFTSRSRAPNGSAFPRYTYLTVRTRDGATSRLLVQDNDPAALRPGRASALDPSARSFLVPSVVNATSALGNRFVSKLRLSNLGTDTVQADLVFTPQGADGFDANAVRTATVLVPPGDVVTLTDLLVQVFALAPPAVGSLEVRAAPEKLGLLTVTSLVDAPARDGGTFGFQLPTARRGEGVSTESPHLIPGISATQDSRSNLILAETTGLSEAEVMASLYDRTGSLLGTRSLRVPRYGQTQLSGLGPAFGAVSDLDGASLELALVSGSGAVAAVVTVVDNATDDAVCTSSRPVESPVPSGRRKPLWARAAGTRTSVVPSVANGIATFPGTDRPFTFRSLMGFTSGTQTAARFTLSYRDLVSGETLTRSVTVPGRQSVVYRNVLEELFGLSPEARSHGPVFVESDPNGTYYSKVYSALENGSLGDSFPVVAIPSEALTTASDARPLALDGLEQSVDATRGTRSNLLLNEVSGQPASVTVRLYEAGNRTSPLASADFDLAPYEKLQLSTVFAGLGLDNPERRKDRTNVLCVVVPKSGSGSVAATVTTIDNRTGDTRNLQLAPTGGLPGSGGIGIGR